MYDSHGMRPRDAGEEDGSMVRVAQPHDELGNAMQAELDVTRIDGTRLGIAGRVLRTSAASRVDDTSRDRDFDRTVDCAPGYVITSCLSAPVVGSQRRVLGAVQLCNRQENGGRGTAFSDVDTRLLAMFTTLLSAHLERQLVLDVSPLH